MNDLLFSFGKVDILIGCFCITHKHLLLYCRTAYIPDDSLITDTAYSWLYFPPNFADKLAYNHYILGLLLFGFGNSNDNNNSFTHYLSPLKVGKVSVAYILNNNNS